MVASAEASISRRLWPCRQDRAVAADRALDGCEQDQISLVVVAGAADVGVKDRHAVRWALMCGMPIELVVEDGANRAVSERADLDGARGSGFEPAATERTRQTENAQAGAESLFGMRPFLYGQVAKCSRRR